jgi:hypothetical protein
MPLASLKVIGPISTLVTSVRVHGQLVGARVSVISLADHQVKASGIAARGDQRFDLLPNISLNKNDRLVATQTQGIDTSALPAEHQSISVQQAPQDLSDIGLVKIEAHIYYYDEYYLWVSGCIPGAVVEAFFNGMIQGRGVSDEGVVRLKLATKPDQGELVSVHQMVKGVGTGANSTNTLEPLPSHAFRKPLDPLIRAYG